MLAHACDFAEDADVLCAGFDQAFEAIVEFRDGDDLGFVRTASARPLGDDAIGAGPEFRNGIRVSSAGVREIGAWITSLHAGRGVARKCAEGK